MAVRDLDGPVREPDAFDECASGDDHGIDVGRNAQRPRGIWIKRKKHAMTLAEEQTLQVARPQNPTLERTVAAAIVEERVDRRERPHQVQCLDDALSASVGDEILVRERDPHRPNTRCRTTSAANSGNTRWRRQRRGSMASRHSHSKPTAWTSAGGNRTRPAS